MSAALSGHQAFVHIFLCFHTYWAILITLLKKRKTIAWTALHKHPCIYVTLDENTQVCILLCYNSEHSITMSNVCVCKPTDILFLLPDLCGSLSPSSTLPLPSVFFSRLWGRGEDETSQPSVDPALHHAFQECEGGLKEGLRYVSSLIFQLWLWNLQLPLGSRFMCAAVSSLCLNFMVASKHHWLVPLM